MTDSRVAKRYARALFNAALKQTIVSSVDDDLAGITDALKNSDKFRVFLKNPNTTDVQKLQVFEKTFGDRVTALSLEFIRMLIRKGRDEQLFQIQLEYAALKRDHENITRAIVTSADELSQDEKNNIVSTIESKLGRKLEAEFAIDPKLMGGVTVAYDDYVLDGSVRGKLDRLRERMIYDLLKQA